MLPVRGTTKHSCQSHHSGRPPNDSANSAPSWGFLRPKPLSKKLPNDWDGDLLKTCYWFLKDLLTKATVSLLTCVRKKSEKDLLWLTALLFKAKWLSKKR